MAGISGLCPAFILQFSNARPHLIAAFALITGCTCQICTYVYFNVLLQL